MDEGSAGPVYDERFVVSDRREEVENLQQTLMGALQAGNYDDTSCFAVRLALEEALSNAFKHGNRSDPTKSVTVACRIEPRTVTLEIEDQGEGFDPQTVPDPTVEENIEIPSGRGIVLMRAFMTDVQFHPPGNRVRIVYERPA